ncbi:hypothetical protein BCR36DRAFT_144796 [Piromyces finnis]|uniref:Uncharacterized protein n=1 Tax=Piromyces finnis TaxID=1754191 RepID=A0A1Y1UYF0_9FUNG|nr:hypothetical protein BCR36DRAFT_144796 [Piromyces finnis]|eukprot:ORX43443.1 hypothetical protein BCR36DRAFT_144796 [Piromyces finnis]
MITVFQANVLNTIVNLIFISRSFRVILLYRYNIFKVSSVKKKKLNDGIEPNYYLPRIYKKIKWIIILFITIPSVNIEKYKYYYINNFYKWVKVNYLYYF